MDLRQQEHIRYSSSYIKIRRIRMAEQKSDTIESLYADAVLYKMFKEKVISRAVYECALEKFKTRFQE